MLYSVYVRFTIFGDENEVNEFTFDLGKADILYFRDQKDFFVNGDCIEKVRKILDEKGNLTYKIY